MKEWKELEIDNLPGNFGKENYVFEVYHEDEDKWHEVYKDSRTIATIISYLKDGCIYRYRKPESKQPTHEEILERVKRELSIQIDTKISDMKKTIIWYMNALYDTLESADITPEGQKE